MSTRQESSGVSTADLVQSVGPTLQKVYNSSPYPGSISYESYRDIFFHSLAHPNQTVTGICLGYTDPNDNNIHIIEIVPESHTNDVSNEVLYSALDIVNMRITCQNKKRRNDDNDDDSNNNHDDTTGVTSIVSGSSNNLPSPLCIVGLYTSPVPYPKLTDQQTQQILSQGNSDDNNTNNGTTSSSINTTDNDTNTSTNMNITSTVVSLSSLNDTIAHGPLNSINRSLLLPLFDIAEFCPSPLLIIACPSCLTYNLEVLSATASPLPPLLPSLLVYTLNPGAQWPELPREITPSALPTLQHLFIQHTPSSNTSPSSSSPSSPVSPSTTSFATLPYTFHLSRPDLSNIISQITNQAHLALLDWQQTISD